MTMGQVDLLDKGSVVVEPGKSSKRAAEYKWTLVTNHLNLTFMLAAGLILPKSGFGRKYYQDTLDCNPGWIVLYRDIPPIEAVEHCISENKILKPCVLEIDLSRMEGVVPALRAGVWCEFDLSDGCSDIDCILLPAPLPLTVVKCIIFFDKPAISAFKEQVAVVDNCPISDFSIKARKIDFKGKSKLWPLPSHSNTGIEESDLRLTDAMGGAIANLNFLANCNDTAISVLAYFNCANHEKLSESKGSISSKFHDWWRLGGSYEKGTTAENMFWAICTSLVDHKNSPDFGSNRDIVLEGFQKIAEKEGVKALAKSQVVISDIRRLYQNLDVTFTELLNKHDTPLPRALVLFFTHDNINSILESDRSSLGEEEIVLAAILLGLAGGWLEMSETLKTYANLGQSASCLMAQTAFIGPNEYDQNSLLTKATMLPVSIRGYLASDGWGKKEKEAAVLLCKAMKWPHLKTRITLGEGNYSLEIKRGGVQIVLDGEAKSVSLEVAKEDVLQSMRELGELPILVEAKMRELLRG